eukprot:scaffold288080_cov36-Tisochrysis_lutea.AAC.1
MAGSCVPQYKLEAAYRHQLNEEFCDVSRFPAIQMLRQRAASLVVSKHKLRKIEQMLRQEEDSRFDKLCTAEWRGKHVGNYEHLQGRVGHVTYHFIFATINGQPTDDVSGFIAMYETSEQRLDEILSLISMQRFELSHYRVLVRLLYLIAYVRTSMQTEESITALSDIMEYNEVVDKLYDYMVHMVQTDAQALDVSVTVAQGLDRLTKRILHKYPQSSRVFGPDMPVMRHLQTVIELPKIMKRIGAEASRAIAGSEHFDPNKCIVLNGIKEGQSKAGGGRRRGGVHHRHHSESHADDALTGQGRKALGSTSTREPTKAKSSSDATRENCNSAPGPSSSTGSAQRDSGSPETTANR